MFDIGATELLVIAIVAILVIGPKDMPLALRTAGRWIGKIRRVSGHFRSGIDAMIREAEMEEMEKKWKERNAKIMAEHPPEEYANEEMQPLAATDPEAGASAEAALRPKAPARETAESTPEPQFPLDSPKAD